MASLVDAIAAMGRRAYHRSMASAKPVPSSWIAAVTCALVACGTASPDAKTPSPDGTASGESTASASPSGAPTASGDPVAPTSSVASSATGTAAAAATPATASTSAASTPAPPALPTPTLVLVEPTKPSGKPPVLAISAPAKSALIPAAKAAAFEAKVSAKGWKPAAGDHLCVVLDRGSCHRVEDASKPVRLGELGALDEGQHVFSVLARRATGEFYRAEGKSVPFASVSFFVGKKVPPTHKDGSPMLFYTPPQRGPAPSDGVLIDFFVANAAVKKGDYVVTASVGGPGIERGVGLAIEENKPIRLQNARPGEYISRMTLLQYTPDLGATKAVVTVTYSAQPVTGPFGEITRSFFVTK